MGYTKILHLITGRGMCVIFCNHSIDIESKKPKNFTNKIHCFGPKIQMMRVNIPPEKIQDEGHGDKK